MSRLLTRIKAKNARIVNLITCIHVIRWYILKITTCNGYSKNILCQIFEQFNITLVKMYELLCHKSLDEYETVLFKRVMYQIIHDFEYFNHEHINTVLKCIQILIRQNESNTKKWKCIFAVISVLQYKSDVLNGNKHPSFHDVSLSAAKKFISTNFIYNMSKHDRQKFELDCTNELLRNELGYAYKYLMPMVELQTLYGPFAKQFIKHQIGIFYCNKQNG